MRVRCSTTTVTSREQLHITGYLLYSLLDTHYSLLAICPILAALSTAQHHPTPLNTCYWLHSLTPDNLLLTTCYSLLATCYLLQGALNNADWDYIAQTMDRSKRNNAFCGPEVYKLVTRRRDRDRLNLETLKAEIAGGKPAIRIPASNSSTVATAAHDDEVGLPSTLFLCIGARAMITHNICIELGLCNGTVGIVHDIMCDSDGKPVAVLLRVKRRTATRDGYAGPSFLDSADGVDKDQEMIVAISRWSADIWDSGQMSTRSQFPLMVSAHAFAVHGCFF